MQIQLPQLSIWGFCLQVRGASEPRTGLTGLCFDVHVPEGGRADDVTENTAEEKNACEGDFSMRSLEPGVVTSAINNTTGNSTRVLEQLLPSCG